MEYEIEIKTINKEDIPYIRNICSENGCECFISYNYETLSIEEFEINAYIKSENFNKAKFVEYLYNRRIKRINKLNAILNNEVKV